MRFLFKRFLSYVLNLNFQEDRPEGTIVLSRDVLDEIVKESYKIGYRTGVAGDEPLESDDSEEYDEDSFFNTTGEFTLPPKVIVH